MNSWADLCTQLLVFFVLLVSMANFDEVKIGQVLGYYQTTTGGGYNIPTQLDPVPTQEFFVQIVRASAVRQETPEGGYRPELAGENIRVTSFKDNFVVKFTERPFFERFEVRLTTEGKRRLDSLAAKLKNSVNVVYVIGRTSADENEEQFETMLQTVQLSSGTAVRVLATPMERFGSEGGRAVLMDTTTVLIQSRDELAAKRAETVGAYMEAAGVSRARIREVAGEEKRGPAEELFETRAGVGSFVFAYGGADAGRNVEIVVTGEVVRQE
ncbi:MAG: hypothetical protein IT463_09535 [Planctomycetes bacterium]|nr:hypothetical protein [Planctomycetota bacterium]